MKIFYYFGRNAKTKGGTSAKLWKIERRGKVVHTWFGPADMVNRQLVPRGKLRTHQAAHPTEDAARADEKRRIAEQEKQHYQRKATRRRPKS